MNTTDLIAPLVKDLMGLDVRVLGDSTIERIVARTAEERGYNSIANYLQSLADSVVEQRKLIEALVVTESWFLREQETLRAIATYITRRSAGPLRVLSIPCARGEEAISMLLVLAEAGFDSSCIEVVGVDISEINVRAAGEAVYNSYSFRGCDPEFIQRYFCEQSNGQFALLDTWRRSLRYLQGNALHIGQEAVGAFDVILCRNLLIYLGVEEQKRLITSIKNLLVAGGLVAVASAEASLLSQSGLRGMSEGPSSLFELTDRDTSVPHAAKTVSPVSSVGHKGVKAKQRRIASTPSKTRLEQEVPVSSTMGVEELSDLADRGNYAEARLGCLQLLAAEPANQHANFLLGLIADRAGDAELACQQYRKTLYLDPDHAEAALALSLMRGNKKQADSLGKRARKLMQMRTK